MGLYLASDFVFDIPEEYANATEEELADLVAEIASQQEEFTVDESTGRFSEYDPSKFVSWLVIKTESGMGWDEWYVGDELATLFGEDSKLPYGSNIVNVERVDD